MKTATIILVAGLLSASAAAHAQSVAGANGTPATAIDPTALLGNLQSIKQMSSDSLNQALLLLGTTVQSNQGLTGQQLNQARVNGDAATSATLQAQLDTLQRMMAQTSANQAMVPAAPAAPTLPSGMTQAQYQQLLKLQKDELTTLQLEIQRVNAMPIVTPVNALFLPLQLQQDQIVRPTAQQQTARTQLAQVVRTPHRYSDQQRQQAEALMKQGQWAPPAPPAPPVVLTAQQQAQLAAMVTPQHQALLSASAQADEQLKLAQARMAELQTQLRGQMMQVTPGRVATMQAVAQTQRSILEQNGVIAQAAQKATLARQQAAPAFQALAAQAAAAAQMRAQRAQMTPQQLALEKAQEQQAQALQRAQQLKVAQQQLPVVQRQLQAANEQLQAKQKLDQQQLAQLKETQQQQLAAAQARMDALQKQPPSTPGWQQQMQAAGQQMGGLQRQQQQQLQGMQQSQYQDQQSQQKNVAGLQQQIASLQQQIQSLQAQPQQAAALPDDVQKLQATMAAANAAQLQQIMQAIAARNQEMIAVVNSKPL